MGDLGVFVSKRHLRHVPPK
jgi:hypothetical protein